MVVDPDGTPIEGAVICRDRKWDRATIHTDAEGRFLVASSPLGRAGVTVELEPGGVRSGIESALEGRTRVRADS